MLTTYHIGTYELVLWIFNLLTQADSYADEALNNTSVIILRCQYQNGHFRHRSYYFEDKAANHGSSKESFGYSFNAFKYFKQHDEFDCL